MTESFITIGDDLIGAALLHEVTVTQGLNQHSFCELVCRQTEDERYAFENALGKDLKVVTNDEESVETTVFDGIIIDAELEYEIWGSYRATLRAVTRTWKMSLTPRHAYFKEKNLTEIANLMAGRVGLKALVDCPDKRPLRYMQWGESDFDFLLRLAADHGCWLRPIADGFEIQQAFQKTLQLNWRDELGLLGFRARGTLGPASFGGAHYNFHDMRSKTWTGVKQAPEFFDAIAPLVSAVQEQSDKMPPGYVGERSRIVTLDEFESMLKQTSARSVGGSVTATGESLQPQLLPGDQVQIDGVLDAQGTFGMVSVVHRWTTTGYSNQFSCTPWKNYTNPIAPVPRPCFGVVSARVVDHNDPKQMGRIKIQFYWQDEEPTEWARMMTPHAGGERGFMFMPEVGDEVVVAFEDGDPERPVVLGCLWNGVDGAPRKDFWGADVAPNDVKRIVTKSGTRIQMVDKKGKESIMFSTPNSVRIALMESSNETHRETLLLHTDLGDIILSAPNGRVHVHSKYFSREVGERTYT